MTWPRSTWTAWKSDSTNPSLLVPLQGEGLDPGSCILDLWSCLLSPCIQLWLCSSPCLDETLSAIREKAHWTTCNILLTSFFLCLRALIQPVLFCATLHLPNQRTLNRSGVHFIYDHCQGSRTTCCTPQRQRAQLCPALL